MHLKVSKCHVPLVWGFFSQVFSVSELNVCFVKPQLVFLLLIKQTEKRSFSLLQESLVSPHHCSFSPKCIIPWKLTGPFSFISQLKKRFPTNNLFIQQKGNGRKSPGKLMSVIRKGQGKITPRLSSICFLTFPILFSLNLKAKESNNYRKKHLSYSDSHKGTCLNSLRIRLGPEILLKTSGLKKIAQLSIKPGCFWKRFVNNCKEKKATPCSTKGRNLRFSELPTW